MGIMLLTNKKAIASFVTIIFTFLINASAQIDEGSKAEQFVSSVYDVDNAVQSMFNEIHVSYTDSIKLTNYFKSQYHNKYAQLVREHLNDKSLYSTQYAKGEMEKLKHILIKEYLEHGMEIVEDEVAKAIKRGVIFKGPFNLPTPVPPPAANGPCTNMDFEAGDLSGWEGTSGEVDQSGLISYSYINSVPDLTAPQHEIMNQGNDPMLQSATLPVVNPDGGAFSVRLGDLSTGAKAAEIKQTFLVSPSNFGFSYSYAVVLQDPGDHKPEEKPYFSIRVYDDNGNLIDCGTFNVIAGAGLAGFKDDIGAGGTVLHRYKEWSTVFIPLGAYLGRNVTVVFRSGDCTKTGHYGYAYIDAKCTPMPLLVTKVNGDCNNPNAVLTAPNGGNTYLWSPGGQTTQSITVTTPGHYEVTISSNAGANCTTTLEYDYKANAKPPVADFTSTDGCLGVSTTFTDLSVSNTSDAIRKWEWDFGNGKTSNAKNPIFDFTVGGVQNVTLKVTNSDGCVHSVTHPVQVYQVPEFDLKVVYNCNALPIVNVELLNQVVGGNYEYRIKGGAWQNSPQFLNIPDGLLSIEVRLNGKCPVTKDITIKNYEKTTITANPYTKTHCKGDQVTLTSSDANCTTLAWFTDRSTKTIAAQGCSYSFTMGDKDQCVYYEPTTLSSSFTVGTTKVQDWGNSSVASFDALKTITIDGFSIDGDQWWNGCTDFAAQFVVKQGTTVIAGPVNYTIKCDRTKTTIVNGLGLKVPAGTGYTLEVIGATTKITIGTITQNASVMNIKDSGPFYNWKVFESPICPVRDSICIKSKCPCPDITLNIPTPICSNVTFDLNTLKTATTAAGSWKIVRTPAGNSSATLNGGIFNAGKNGDGGDYVVAYVLTGRPFLNCVDSVVVTMHIDKAEVAKIPHPQGVFCVSDPIQTLQLDPTSNVGKWSGNGITDALAGKFNPATAGIGNHLITYKTDGVCFSQDTITITVVNQKISNITSPDTTVCKNASAFKIRLSANTTANGVWLSVPAGLVSNNGTITPSLGQTTVPYKVYYVLQGATLLCSAIDSVTITLIAPDTAKISPNQGPYCVERTALDLRKENISAIGRWSGMGITDVNAGTFNPKTAGVGVKVISYTTLGVCPYVDTVHIEVKAKTISNIVNGDTTLCENTPTYNLKLSSNSTAGGKWYKDNIAANALVQTTPAGNYYLKYVTLGISAECDNRDSVKVTILPNEDASIVTPLKKDVCPSDAEIILQSQIQPSKGIWWGVPNVGVDVSGKYNPLTANIGSTKVYYGVAGKCGDTTNVEFIKHVVPTFDLGEDKILCEGEQVQIGTTVYADTTLWQPSGEKNGLINVSTTGDYILKLSNYPGCKYIDTIHVEVLPYPVINIGNDTILCFEDAMDSLTLDAKNTLCQFVWNTGDTTREIKVFQEGLYSVVANYPNSNCVTTDNIKVVDYCPYTLFFPNAITLNGDGINDKFPTPNHNLKGYHLMIFNRWGELLFETYDDSNLWDGTYEGQKVQEDVYVWKCDYQVEELDKKIVKKTEIGRVTVLR